MYVSVGFLKGFIFLIKYPFPHPRTTNAAQGGVEVRGSHAVGGLCGTADPLVTQRCDGCRPDGDLFGTDLHDSCGAGPHEIVGPAGIVGPVLAA